MVVATNLQASVFTVIMRLFAVQPMPCYSTKSSQRVLAACRLVNTRALKVLSALGTAWFMVAYSIKHKPGISQQGT